MHGFEKEKEEVKEEVEKEGGHNLAAGLSAVGHIHAATVIVAKETVTIGAEIVTIADQVNARLRANNNVELGDALYSAQAQAAAAAAAIAVKDHNRVGIINIDGDGDDGVGCGGYMDWTSGAGICSGDRHDAGGGGGGNGGGTVSGGSSHQIVVKIERIEGVPQAMYAGTGHTKPHGISLAFCASAGEGGNSSLCGSGAEGDAQHRDSLAGKKPASSAVTDGVLDGELQMTEAASAKRGMRSDRVSVPIKREILDIGLLRCPRCQGGVLASDIGCNIVTCRAFHPVTFATEQDRNHGCGGYCHFCYHCRVENIGDHCPSPLCPQRVNPEARAEGLRLRNDHSFRNIIDLSDK